MNLAMTCSFLVHRTEPQIFKTKFIGWDDVIAVDYTRTAESVIRRGADMKVTFYKIPALYVSLHMKLHSS